MKTSRLTTILTSAYLSAMLTSSVAPIRSNAAFASAIDPMAAQKVFRGAISGLAADGWGGAVQITDVVTPNAAVIPVVQNTLAPEQLISEELMTRLITRALASKKPTILPEATCTTLALCAPGEVLPVLQISEPVPDGRHVFTVTLKEGNKDVIISYVRTGYSEIYLTSRTGVLRAAAIWETASGARLITNEQAAEKFKSELRLFAKLALELPPTGAAVAGNS